MTTGKTEIVLTLNSVARRLEADLVYGKLIGNPEMSDGVALFHASHNNSGLSRIKAAADAVISSNRLPIF